MSWRRSVFQVSESAVTAALIAVGLAVQESLDHANRRGGAVGLQRSVVDGGHAAAIDRDRDRWPRRVSKDEDVVDLAPSLVAQAGRWEGRLRVEELAQPEETAGGTETSVCRNCAPALK